MYWPILILILILISLIFVISLYASLIALPILLVCACIFLPLFLYAFCTIPYFNMAKNTEIRHAWLIFLPFTQKYILLQLSDRIFALPIKKQLKKRTTVYWLRLLYSAFMPLFYFITFSFYFTITTLVTFSLVLIYPEEYMGVSTIPVIDYIFGAIAIIGTLLYFAFMIYTSWHIYYDILILNYKKSTAICASIANILLPFIVPSILIYSD